MASLLSQLAKSSQVKKLTNAIKPQQSFNQTVAPSTVVQKMGQAVAQARKPYEQPKVTLPPQKTQSLNQIKPATSQQSFNQIAPAPQSFNQIQAPQVQQAAPKPVKTLPPAPVVAPYKESQAIRDFVNKATSGGTRMLSTENQRIRERMIAEDKARMAQPQSFNQIQPAPQSFNQISPSGQLPSAQPRTQSLTPPIQSSSDLGPSSTKGVTVGDYLPKEPVDQNLMNALAQSPSFSLEEYMNASPEQQMAMQAQAFNQGGQQRLDLGNQLYSMEDQMIAEREREAQAKLEEEKMRLEGAAEEDIAAFKADQEAMKAEAAAQIQRAGEQRVEQANETMAFQGFGRSTKAMEIKDNVLADTQAQIASIERQSNQAITQYQASALDKNNARIEKLQERVDQFGDARDQLALANVKQQGELMQSLFEQNPLNPMNMIKTAEMLSQKKIEMQKLDLEERKAVADAAAKNFTFMVDKFGSEFINSLTPEAKQHYADAVGIPAAVLEKVGKTQEEQKMEWEKLKYVEDREWEAQKFDIENQLEQEKMLAQQDFDMQVMNKKFDFDVNLLNVKSQLETDSALKKWSTIMGGVGGEYAAKSAMGDSSALTFDAPVTHPAGNIQVNSVNVALAQAYPNGFRFKPKGPNDLTGQCKWFSQQLTTLNGQKWSIGSTAADTKNNLAKYVKNGSAFYPGAEEPRVGQTLITNDSEKYWHSAVVNARGEDANGKFSVVTEANYSPLAVGNTRKVYDNSPKIQGVLRTQLKPQYQVPVKVLKTIEQNRAPIKALDALTGGRASAFGNVLKGAATSAVEQDINQRIGLGQLEQQAASQAYSPNSLIDQGLANLGF